jgi:hypothetical protein
MNCDTLGDVQCKNTKCTSLESILYLELDLFVQEKNKSDYENGH